MRYLLFTSILSLGFIMLPGHSLAQSDSTTRQFSTQVGQSVSEAIENIKQNQFETALTKLSQTLAFGEISPYETATIYQIMGSAYYELQRVDEAIAYFKNAVKANGLLPSENQALNLQIARIQIVNEDYREGALGLETWERSGGQLSYENLELLTQAWVNAGEFERALPWAIKWYDGATPKARKHYDLMNLIYYQTGQKDRQIKIVKDMIDQWPEDKALWENLVSLYAATDQEYNAFIVNQLMYRAGFLTKESDVLKMVQYYGYNEIPYDGARILEIEMGNSRVKRSADNLKILSNLWLQAREYDKAIPVLRRIANIKPDKLSYAQLAESLINRGDCAGAETAFKSAMELGYKPGKPWMLVASCLYEESQKLPKPECEMDSAERQKSRRYHMQNAAMSAFKRVNEPRRLKADADKWASFIRAEQDQFTKQCDAITDIEKTRCILDIDQAEKSRVFNGGERVLSDASCIKYLADYEAAYGAKAVMD